MTNEINDTLAYIHSVSNYFCKPGLDRIKTLCDLLGNPQDKLKFIHVAGTNGKGSFCSMLSSVLTKSGYKTGLYTSPYIIKFNERISIDSVMISDEALTRITNKIKKIVDKVADKPTEFEMITAIAFQYFYENNCDFVVLECGLGGRYDATNIIKTSILSVITGISIDHTNFLGNTVKEIAFEKAGIIKRNVPCLWCGNDNDAYEVIANEASKNNANLFIPDYKKLNVTSCTLEGTNFDYKNYKNLHIRLLGLYQPYNAANVIEAIEILKKQSVDICNANIIYGLETTVWHARFEVLCNRPFVIFDGGHNPEGIEAAVLSAKKYFENQRFYVITGVMKDKNYSFIADKIGEIAKKVICISPNNVRALNADEYSKVFIDKKIPSVSYDNISEAFNDAYAAAISDMCPILCVGSLYMYGEILECINSVKSEK